MLDKYGYIGERIRKERTKYDLSLSELAKEIGVSEGALYRHFKSKRDMLSLMVERIEEDLVDQLFNSSEKRLARILLLLAHFGKETKVEELIVPKISQETLADMVGTTRSRVSFFLNKFRKLGFIDYNGGLRIRSSLLNIVLLD